MKPHAHAPQETRIPTGRILADSSLYAVLFGALAAGLGAKDTAQLILFLPLSLALGLLNGTAVCIVARHRGLPVSFPVCVVAPALSLAAVGFAVGLRWWGDIRFSWMIPSLVIYGLFVGIGAGIGAAAAANRRN